MSGIEAAIVGHYILAGVVSGIIFCILLGIVLERRLSPMAYIVFMLFWNYGFYYKPKSPVILSRFAVLS